MKTNEQILAEALLQAIEHFPEFKFNPANARAIEIAKQIVNNIEEEKTIFKEGMEVKHPKYGKGTVSYVWNSSVTYPVSVRFGNILASYNFTLDGRYNQNEEPSLTVVESDE